MRPTDGGANFGWRVLEGTAVFNGTPTAAMVPPVAEYLHGTGPRQGNSVTGGYVYRGPVEALRGQYIFADFVSGNIWSIPIARVSLGTTIPSEPVHPAQTPISRPMPARSTMSRASASTRPAISTSSILTARFSGSRRS